MTNTVTLSVTRFYYDGDPLRFAARAGSQRLKQVESRGGTTITTAYAGAIEVTITGTQRITQAYYMADAQRVATRVITSTGSVVYYLHGDHLGSPSLVTTGAGAEVARQMYLPYGAPRWGSGTLPTDFTFTGQRADATGLMYYRARYYSSSLGRFVSADTMVPSPGNPADLNRYSYTRGNPVKYTDPTGHAAECGYTAGGSCGEEGHVDWKGKTTDESWGDYFQRTGMNKLSDRDIAVVMTTPFWASASAVAGGGTLEGGAALVKAATRELILEGYACAQSGLCRLAIQAALAKILNGKTGASSPSSSEPPDVIKPSFREWQPDAQAEIGGGTKLYRIYGGSAGPNGHWWTLEPPASEIQWRIDYAVRPEWNDSTGMAVLTVPEGETLTGWIGRASAQGDWYVGGGTQINLPSVPQDWITTGDVPWGP